jgi:hypothetical protein
MKRILILLLMATATLITAPGARDRGKSTGQPSKNLDLKRYLGTWYEIARFPHSFEKDLQGVTATYSLREDGKIKVLNQATRVQSTVLSKLLKPKQRFRIRINPHAFESLSSSSFIPIIWSSNWTPITSGLWWAVNQKTFSGSYAAHQKWTQQFTTIWLTRQ